MTPRIGPLLVGDQPLPHSPPAERGLVSCALQDMGHCLTDLAGYPDEIFHLPSLRVLFGVLKRLPQPDVLTLEDELRRQGKLEEVGGSANLQQLLCEIETTARYKRYRDLVMRDFAKRATIRAATTMVGKLYEGEESLTDAYGTFEQELADVATAGATRIKRLGDIVENVVEDVVTHNTAAAGYATAFKRLNQILVGLRPGYMYVLAARPSVGKSALAHNLILHFAQQHGPVGIVSLEMSAESITKRFLAAKTCCEIGYNVPDAIQQAQLWRAAAEFQDLPIFFEDSPHGNAQHLRQRIRGLYHRGKIRLGVVDYLQLFQGSGVRNQSREREVALLSSTCKQMATEFNIPMLVLCQLNRSVDEAKRPKLAHLRESGAIEQDADGVILLHRHETPTDTDTAKRIADGHHIELEAIVAKHRNGRTGAAKLAFYPKFTLFRDEPIYNWHNDPTQPNQPNPPTQEEESFL